MRYTLEKGLFKQSLWLGSPNYDHRPSGIDVELLVIHCISLPPGCYGKNSRHGTHYVQDFFQNKLDCSAHEYFATLREVQVSAHLFIERSGDVSQFVNLANRAWHAGKSSYKGRDKCNDFSIGIELEGLDSDSYSSEQYKSLVDVTIAIQEAYPAISNENIVGHDQIAPDRKTDPGPHFDWDWYKQALVQYTK